MPFTAKQHSRTTLRQRRIKYGSRALLLLSVLLVGGCITSMVLAYIWMPQPDKDPRIQTPLNTSLLLDIPEDHHYTYICLHYHGWRECIQLKHHGNITFNMTVERTISEAHHDRSKADIAASFLWGCLLASILVLFLSRCYKKYFNLHCGTTTTSTGCQMNVVAGGNVMEAPPPQSEKTASSPLIPGPPDVSSRVDNRVGHSCAVNIISQIDSSFDAGPEFIGSIDGHVKELEAKIKASNSSSEGPLKPRTYDCFIIYSREDEDIVYNKLIPFFNSNNIKYCEHQEHFELGKDIFDNVNICIKHSRRVVAVLSRSFFASGHCMYDLKSARGYAADNGYSVQDFLISIKITNFEFPNKYRDIGNSTYADLSKDVNDERKWLQIKKALTEFSLASVVIEMGAKYSTPKLRLPVQDVSVV